jgi:hypothetical protein
MSLPLQISVLLLYCFYMQNSLLFSVGLQQQISWTLSLCIECFNIPCKSLNIFMDPLEIPYILNLGHFAFFHISHWHWFHMHSTVCSAHYTHFPVAQHPTTSFLHAFVVISLHFKPSDLLWFRESVCSLPMTVHVAGKRIWNGILEQNT